MGAAAMLGGMAFSAMGSHEAGKTNQAINDRNATVSNMIAADTIKRGRIEGRNLRRQTAVDIGYNNAILSASGVDISDTDATPANINANFDMLSKEDELVVYANAAREAWGYEVQAQDYTMRGKLAKSEGNMRALSTVVSGSTGYFSDKYGFAQRDKLGVVNSSTTKGFDENVPWDSRKV